MQPIDALMQQAIADKVFPGAVLFVSREGAVLFHRAYGITDPVGKRFHKQFGNYKEGDFVTIIGVIKDINFHSLHLLIEPMIIRNIATTTPTLLSVKCRNEERAETLMFLEEKWRYFTNGQPFEYTFFDDDMKMLYDNEEKLGEIFGIFAGLAILIACLGLFGLVSFSAQRRTREIGIRKTLGSSELGIMRLLSKEFLQQVLAANLIAWPIGWYAMNKWLQNFAYRIDIRMEHLIAIAAITLLVALISVGWQALKAARANPVESLRYE